MEQIKYVDPKSDWGFKKIFGTEESKEILINFLNAFFESQEQPYRKHIQDVTFVNKELLADNNTQKTIIIDVRCRTSDGETFIVEMQKRKPADFIERIVYYAMHANGDLPKGLLEKNGRLIQYKIIPTYVLVLMDFNFFRNQSSVHTYGIMDIKTHELLTDNLLLFFIELKKFPQKSGDKMTMFEKWVYLLNNMASMTSRPEELTDCVFDQVLDIAEYSAMTEQQRQQYEECIMNEQDWMSAVAGAREEGREEGATKKCLEILRKMLVSGNLSDQAICDLLSVTMEELQEMKSLL